MKLFFLFLLSLSSLLALGVNESLLKIHATLVPKIYLMDYNFQTKIEDNTIVIAIIYKEIDYQNANTLKKMIEARYKDGIQSYKIKPIMSKYADIKNFNANIYYMFPSSKKEIKSVIREANMNNSLTFSYLKEDLKYGVMISLNVSKKIKPLLNLQAIKENDISIRPILLNISTIYTPKIILKEV